MESKAKLTKSQVAYFMYASAAGNIVYTFTFITSIVGRAFWVAVFIGVMLNIPFALWILFLGKHLQGDTIFEIFENGLGKIISKILILIYLIINIAAAACMLNMFTGTLKVFFLQKTPSFIIMLFLIVICTVFVNSGLKTFARLVEILSLFFIVNYFSGFFLSFFKLFKIEYVIPVFDSSGIQFFKGILVTAGNTSECLLLLMVIVGSVPMEPKRYQSVIKGLTIWSTVLAIAILLMEGDIGCEMLSRVAQAGITVSRVIQIQSFIRGLEILILMTYQYIAINKITIFIYSCYISSQKLFDVQKSKWLLALTAVLIFVASLWLNSFNSGYYFSIFLGNYIIPPFVLLVLILATLYIALKKVNIRKS